MIDRPKRDRLAQALRQLLSGRIDNLAFDDLDCPGNITIRMIALYSRFSTQSGRTTMILGRIPCS